MNDPTELHEAASLGNKRLLQTLLVEGHYDVDSEDWTYERKTPLHVAVERGKYLLSDSCARPKPTANVLFINCRQNSSVRNYGLHLSLKV